MRQAALTLVLLAAGSVTASAQTARPLADLDLADLMRIEVQSVFGASKVLQKVTDAPAAVSIVTARDIALYGYRTLADILRSAPGFNVTDDRNYSYVGVRGFQRSGDYNSRVLLMVDGHRLNDPIYNMAYLGTEFVVDVNLIERVELIRGPSSSLYGTNAFLGVINVITKKGEAVGGLELSGVGGSQQVRQGQAAFGAKFRNGLDLLVSGSRYRTGGETNVYAREFDDPATNNGVASHLDSDAAHRWFAAASFKGLSVQGVVGARRKDVPTASFGTAFNDPRFQTRDAQGWANLKYARLLPRSWRVSSRLYYDSSSYRVRYPYKSTDGVSPDALIGGSSDAGSWGAEANVQKTLAGRHRVTGGAEYRHNFRLHQKGFDAGTGDVYLDDRRSSRDAGLFGEDQFAIHEKLLLNAGVRIDQYQYFATTTNPRLALIFKPGPKTAIKALWGTAFRAPNAYEMYYNSASLGLASNLNLAPERIRTTEIVAERYFSDRYRVMVNTHRSVIDGLISPTTNATGDFVYRNLGSVLTRGVEAEGEGKWTSGFSARLSYSYQRANDAVSNEPLVNSARHLATANVTSPPIRRVVFAAMDLHYVGSVRTLDGTVTRPFVVPNVTLTTRGHRGLTFSANVRNLFDQRYGYPGRDEHRQNIIHQRGRTVVVGLNYAWRAGK